MLAVLVFTFALFVFFHQKFYIFTAFIVFVVLYSIQEVYKRKPNTFDIDKMLIFPFSKISIVNKYLISDLLEYKSVIIAAYLILICIYIFRLLLFITLLFIAFSFCLSLYNFLVKRYNSAYQTHLLIRAPLSLLMILPYINIFLGTENAKIYGGILRNIENHIIDHIFSYTIAMALMCLLIYFCVANLMKKVILARPFANDKIMEKG